MEALVSLVEKWSLTECIVALVYDTTASNSGEWNGAAILIEKRLNRAVLRCECRHHVAELHIKHTFKVVFGENKAPTIKLFQRLKEDFDKEGKQEWLNIPSEHWHNFEDFKKAKHFVNSFLCTNDSAERGIKLITDYKDSCFGIEEREYLAQVVEKHRMSFKATSGQASGQTYNKKTMESVFHK